VRAHSTHPHVLSSTLSGDREVRTERLFNASRERVWKALTDPAQVAQWWGRGHRLLIERMEVKRGGRWRFVEHAPDGVHGFEGRFREVCPPERLVQTFEWDGMPGLVAIITTCLEAVNESQTRLTTVSLFHTTDDRDAMLAGGMTVGLEKSYRALDVLLTP
jgi:uncharacterized protein YndB with AHSA1/START domain